MNFFCVLFASGLSVTCRNIHYSKAKSQSREGAHRLSLDLNATLTRLAVGLESLNTPGISGAVRPDSLSRK